jgi:hypothetical protein
MSTLYNIGEMNQLADALENAGFTSNDVTRLRSFSGLTAIKSVVNGLAKVVMGTILRINRRKPFDPVSFPGLGEGWKIAEQDAQSLAITEVDISKISLETTLKEGETSVGGEEKQKRLKSAKHVRLDAAVFQAFWENQGMIPEEWKKAGLIFFDGTILLSSRGSRCVLSLYWLGSQWHWGRWLVNDFDSRSPSAVLASV